MVGVSMEEGGMLCKRKAKEKPLCLWNSELISSPSGLIAKPLHQSVSTSAMVHS